MASEEYWGAPPDNTNMRSCMFLSMNRSGIFSKPKKNSKARNAAPFDEFTRTHKYIWLAQHKFLVPIVSVPAKTTK